VESVKGEFIDSAHYDGWRNIKDIPTDEPNAKFEGMKIKEDEKYIWIAQTEKHPFYGNILKIPKVSIIGRVIVLAALGFLLIYFGYDDIKSTLLALLP